MSDAVTLDSVFVLAKQLPLAEKVRLIEWIAPQIERELLSNQRGSRKSLRGLWRGLGITERIWMRPARHTLLFVEVRHDLGGHSC